MGPPELPGGNPGWRCCRTPAVTASMGPPELPGGNPGWRCCRTPAVTASMGPPELPGGNTFYLMRPCPWWMRLQWGRRNYPAETRLPVGLIERLDRWLQWGRRNYPAETHHAAVTPEGRGLASMGPPELPGGNTGTTSPATAFGASASMGPPELPGGNVSHAMEVASLESGFNGAAGITRRKQAGEVRDRRLHTRASMGPPELPGGNGAPQAPTRPPTPRASMGPPELPGGNLGSQDPCRSRDDASMGPPELPGGNQFDEKLQVARKLMLQWGRRNYPAETRGRATAGRAGLGRFNGAAGITRRKRAEVPSQVGDRALASMGPPELPGGNVSSARMLPRSTSMLQWGRRNYPAETHLPARDVHAAQAASMGPPELPGGNLRVPGERAERGAASMGPPELPGGNRDSDWRPMCGRTRLQWGRRNYPAET